MVRLKYKIRYALILVNFCLFFNVFSQTGYELHGWVRGLNNEPIKDVTISVLGSKEKPVVSDENGNYSIYVTSGDVWIAFQPIGEWESRTLFLDSRKSLNVYLAKVGYSAYNEKVLGYHRDKLSRDVITAHQSFTEDISDFTGNISIDQSFQKKLTGAMVMNQSGMPGSGASVFLRGLNSLNTTNEPLYVIDGVPVERSRYYESNFEGYHYNPITSLDPFDVSQITVYKDPSYTSQYGFYGANGVVEIATLDPNASTTTIDVKYRTGVDLMPKYIPQLESTQYRLLANEILYSSGMNQEDYMEYYPGLFYTPSDDIEYVPYSNNTNWQDEVFQNTLLQNIYFSIKGGDAIAKYGISVGYLTKTGTIKSTDYDRFNARFSGAFNVIEHVKMNLNVSLVNTNMSLRESGINTVTSPIISALWKSPILSPYDYDDAGVQLNTTADLDELGVTNPLALSRGFEGDNANTRFTTSAKVIGELSQNLDLVTLLSVNYNTMTENYFSPDLGFSAYSNGETSNEVSGYVNTYWGLFSNTYLNYSNNFGKHAFSAQLGAKYSNMKFQNDYAQTGSTPSDAYTSLGMGTNIFNIVGGNAVNYAWLSLNGNFSYNYKSKYFLSANVTSDASTSIGRDASTTYSLGSVPMGVFYSLGGAWRVSNESFMKELSFFDDLKLRMSYGTSGNDDFNVLASQSYSFTDHFNTLGVSIPGNLANTALTYETTSMVNSGIDVILKGGRFQISFDYYNSLVKDMLVYTPLPSFIGESYFPSNLGKLTTQGYELTINTRIVDYKDFTFDVGVDLGKFNTEVLDVPSDRIISDVPGNGQVITSKGGELLSFYGYEYLGVFSSSEESQTANLVNDKGVSYRAGDAKFNDISGKQGVPDQVIDNYDKVSIGSPIPSLTGIISMQLSYKNWKLRSVSQFMTGQEVFNYVRYQNEKMTDLSNQSIKTLQRWTYEGQETNVPQATWGDPVGNSDFSSRWIEDGSYLRLKELSLVYSKAKNFLFMKNFEAYLTVENVLTLTNYTGYDPEISYSASTIFQGIDYGVAPQTRTFIVGLNIGL